ncbi:Anaphase-promoting complex subunit 11 [Diplonema papillatum]|nr:Anaphase-promoting complex subunit 11 [Diplonema papillatum]
MEVTVKSAHSVAMWTWGQEDDACGICRVSFEACCPNCKYPGDDCPLVTGQCDHSFHMHCIVKWVEHQAQVQRPQCPLCRGDWQFKS